MCYPWIEDHRVANSRTRLSDYTYLLTGINFTLIIYVSDTHSCFTEQGFCKLAAFLFGEGVGWTRIKGIIVTHSMFLHLLMSLAVYFYHFIRRRLGAEAVLRSSILTQLINTGLVR